MSKALKKINFRELGILYALVLLWLIFIVSNKNFQKMDAFISILREASFIGICGVGMTLCIASKHFDQSVASLLAFLSCTFTFLMTHLVPSMGWGGVIISILAVLAGGFILGAFNGLLVAKLHIPAFIATLGTLYVYRSFAYLISGGNPTIINQIVPDNINDFFKYLSMGNIGLPVSFWFMILCAIIGTVILRKTRLGRNTLAIGNSVEASRISGINIDRTKILVFMLVGAFVGVGTILNTAFLGSSNPGMQTGFEFRVISAVVLGGTALAGGKGSILNTVIAAIFLVSIKSGMDAYGIDVFAQRIVEGVILLFGFSINGIRQILETRNVKARAHREALERQRQHETDISA